MHFLHQHLQNRFQSLCFRDFWVQVCERKQILRILLILIVSKFAGKTTVLGEMLQNKGGIKVTSLIITDEHFSFSNQFDLNVAILIWCTKESLNLEIPTVSSRFFIWHCQIFSRFCQIRSEWWLMMLPK